MKFLKNWSIDLAKVPAYVDFNTDFEEHFDYELAIMLSNYDKTDENDYPIISQESQTEFKKLLQPSNMLQDTDMVVDMLIFHKKHYR